MSEHKTSPAPAHPHEPPPVKATAAAAPPPAAEGQVMEWVDRVEEHTRDDGTVVTRHVQTLGLVPTPTDPKFKSRIKPKPEAEPEEKP